MTMDSEPLGIEDWQYVECVDLWMVGAMKVDERVHHVIGPTGSGFGCYVYGRSSNTVYVSSLVRGSNPGVSTNLPRLFGKSVDDHRKKCVAELGYTNNKPKDIEMLEKGCPKGFFGRDCLYKCRCNDLQCKDTNKCFQSGCEAGYFGFNCLYKDVLPRAEKVEGFNLNTSMCMETDRVDIVFKESIFFNFLWISSDRNVTEITNFEIFLMSDQKQTIECQNQTSNVIDTLNVKVGCINVIDAKNISIQFEKKERICQVYVNGGRNVAPAGMAEMLFDGVKDDNHGVSANNPVNQRLEGSESCKLIMVFNESTKWALVFQPPVEIYSIRLVIERADLKYSGFQLVVYGSEDDVVFTHTSSTVFQAEHYIKVTNATRIHRVELIIKHAISLCSFEVFGDCPRPRYGLNCDETCSLTCHRDRCNFDGTCIRCNMFRYGPHCLHSTRNWAFNKTMVEIKAASKMEQYKKTRSEKLYWRVLPVIILAVPFFALFVYQLLRKKNGVLISSHANFSEHNAPIFQNGS